MSLVVDRFIATALTTNDPLNYIKPSLNFCHWHCRPKLRQWHPADKKRSMRRKWAERNPRTMRKRVLERYSSAAATALTRPTNSRIKNSVAVYGARS